MNFPAFNMPEFLEIPVTQQEKLVLIIIYLIIIISSNPTKSQSLPSSPTDDTSKSSDSTTNIQPSLAVVIGVLSILMSLTFLLLVYARCWHTPSSLQYLNQENFGVLPPQDPRVSGIDKTVIESLPVFRFSTLKGWKNGLECCICLSRFEDIEILRLLPKCKHAFHIDCVDRWLEKHSGCPLCRCEVSEEDATLFAHSSSFRFSNNQSACEGSNLELFVEREGSTRFGSRTSVQRIEEEDDQEILHKFNHRIIISRYDHDLMGKNRWSSLSSSDLLVLKSEMWSEIQQFSSSASNFVQDEQETIASMPGNKLDHPPIKTGGNYHNQSGEPDFGSSSEPKSAKLVEKRSMSEIIVHPRFLGVESSNKEASFNEISAKEERLKRLWLPIARRTIQMFANRDQPPQINTRSQV
ncbi:hypothetical protein L1987_50111 [Smallanthus sonchifolius]|uniref:Uncharacterized protein n=1 Tax=Smallanthus sonchifolius TaxID=185202 RepID=A0ACB9FWB7_9ASTR|nr:hypothetical protein L1987_50111 [Smallanthus sonchifolius]